MKKAVVSVFIVLLIFIPTYIAIANYITTQNAPLSNNLVDEIEIWDLDGESHTVAKTKKSGDLVSFFISMNNRAEKVSELPEPLVGTPFYKVSFISESSAEDYKYYFASSDSLSYVEFPDGTVYQLKSEDVNKFLITPYAISLFPDEKLPVLNTASSDVIVPAKVDWNYKIGKEFSKLSGFKTTDEIISYDMEGAIDLIFSSDADLYTVKVYDNNSKLILDESTDDLSSLGINSGSELTFMITAAWYEDIERDFYGEATYNFKTKLLAGAEFFIGNKLDDFVPGDFVAITAYNVSNPERISFKSAPSLGYAPKFYKDGDHHIAFVPLDPEIETDSFVFTLSYGSVEQEINLKLSKKTFGKSTITISKNTAEDLRNESTLAEFDKKFEQICSESESTKYFTEPFVDYSQKAHNIKASVKIGYGRYVTVSSTKEQYRNIGVDWRVAKGTEIPACNSGKVVYAGIDTYAGRMVVIDHGLGLKTWYLHLDETKVKVGDIVAIGDTIGTAGKTGFAEANGVYTIMTVGNIPVSPYRTWTSGTGIDIYTK
ncbi:MAG: M23 family metallopeptidase [Clostridia bacterium]|nr:M23 family metallopeptidase [Clostridia bacterium]